MMCSLCVLVCVFGQHCLSSLRGTIIAGNPFHGRLICFGQGHSIPLPAPHRPPQLPSPTTSFPQCPRSLLPPPLPLTHLLFFALPWSRQGSFFPAVFRKGHPPPLFVHSPPLPPLPTLLSAPHQAQPVVLCCFSAALVPFTGANLITWRIKADMFTLLSIRISDQ